MSEFDEELVSNTSHIKKLKQEIMTLKDKNDILDSKNREILKSNQALENSNLELQTKLKDVISAKKDLQADLDQREEENTKYNLEISEKLAQFEDVNKQLAKTNNIIQQKEDEIVVLKAREYDNVYNDGQIDDIKIKYKKLEDERSKLEIQLDKTDRE